MEFGGIIRNDGTISVQENAFQEAPIVFARDTVFTGGGRFEVHENTPGLLPITGGEIEYPFRENVTDPLPDMPEPRRIVNDDHVFRWSGEVVPVRFTQTFEFDPVGDGENIEYVDFPLTAPLTIENLADGVIESSGNGLRFSGMNLANSGLLRSANGAALEFFGGSIANAWVEYDPTDPFGPTTPTLGEVAAEDGVMRFLGSSVFNGTMFVGQNGGMEIADGETRFAGVEIEIADSATVAILSGGALRLVDRALFFNGQNVQSLIRIGDFAELRIEANDDWNLPGELMVGDPFVDATLTIEGSGNASSLRLDTADIAFGPAALRGSEFGDHRLNLSGIDIVGRGEIGDALTVRIGGDDTRQVSIEAEGTLRFLGNAFEIAPGARLVERAGGEVIFDVNVDNQGTFLIEDGDGSVSFNRWFINHSSFEVQDGEVTFADLVLNGSTIHASNSAQISLLGSVLGEGFLVIERDASITVADAVEGFVDFVTGEADGPKAGTLIIQDLAGFDAIILGFGTGDRIILPDIDFGTFVEEDLGINEWGHRLLRFEDADGDEVILRFSVNDDFEYDVASWFYADIGGGLGLLL
jgi:hypothetical protein